MSNHGSKFEIDPETISVIVELIAPLTKELIAAIIENTSKLDELLQKVDQLYLRDIKSGFEALGDGLSSSNKETKKMCLEFAEKALLNNTKLQPGHTGGSPNEFLMAQCHYGLSIIAAQRQDSELAVRHVLRSFVVDPLSSRKKFFPTVFSMLFEPNCSDLYIWNATEISRIERENFEGKVFLEKIAYGSLFAASAGVALFGIFGGGSSRSSVLHGATKGMKSAGEAFEEVSPAKYRDEAKSKQKVMLESKINERCRDLAKIALNDSGRAVPFAE